jgi:putative transposase
LSVEQRRALVDSNDPQFSVREQCRLLSLNRSSLYYIARKESPDHLSLKEAVKFLYFKCPFYGITKTTVSLRKMGWEVGEDKVRRLREELGLQTLYPKPNLSQPRIHHAKYPYLLKGLEITRVNQVWSTDITYVRIQGKGWVYVVAVIDWFSRYILSFEVSTSLEIDFCLEALQNALKTGCPEIFNTDQGSQFTSEEFLKILRFHQTRISMDSKGRALDNIRCERFWRSLKYEEVFLKEYETVLQARDALCNYRGFYNNERIHQSLNYHTPYEIYFGLKDINSRAW